MVVYKRQDGEHYLEITGFLIDDQARVLPPATPAPIRRIEVYGDSVSCGERNEAALYTGKADPDTDLSPTAIRGIPMRPSPRAISERQ